VALGWADDMFWWICNAGRRILYVMIHRSSWLRKGGHGNIGKGSGSNITTAIRAGQWRSRDDSRVALRVKPVGSRL
jgi:hypothetical protein